MQQLELFDYRKDYLFDNKIRLLTGTISLKKLKTPLVMLNTSTLIKAMQ